MPLPTSACGGMSGSVFSTIASAWARVSARRSTARGHDEPRQNHDAERSETDDEQRMTGVLAGDEAQRGEGGGEDAKADGPECQDVRKPGQGDAVDDDPRQKRAGDERDARDERDEIGAHAGAEHPLDCHCASVNSSCHAI